MKELKKKKKKEAFKERKHLHACLTLTCDLNLKAIPRTLDYLI